MTNLANTISIATNRSRLNEPASDQKEVIRVRGLRKSYGDVEAVRGIDLSVYAGEIFAFVGPNGAGKTTAVEILEGYRDRDAGEVQVLGCDPANPTHEWRARIGLVLQTCKMPPELTGRELVSRYAGYFPNPRSVDETLELVGLVDKADIRSGRLSGGQQRRLDVALGLVGNPDLLFLDEPTTGFDPSARHEAWSVLAGLKGLGTTIVLTTHYMDEAESLADRVAVIVRGKIVAEGPPSQLAGRNDAPCEIRFRLWPGIDYGDQLPQFPTETVEIDRGMVRITTRSPVAVLHTLTSWAIDVGIELPDLVVERPSLEDIYLQLTGEFR